MKRFVCVVLFVLPLLAVLAGCGSSKPKPAELPKETIPLPKQGPVPVGTPGKKGEPAGAFGQGTMPVSQRSVGAA